MSIRITFDIKSRKQPSYFEKFAENKGELCLFRLVQKDEFVNYNRKTGLKIIHHIISYIPYCKEIRC